MTRRALYMDANAQSAQILQAFDPASVGDLEIHPGDPEPAALGALLAGRARLLNGHTVMPPDLLEALAETLKRIVFLGTGAANYVDPEAAGRLGIELVTISNYGDRSVAEHAFALMLAAARDVAAMDRALRRGTWQQSAGLELKGKQLGIAGYGGVGAEMAAMAAGFGMEVMVWNRSPVELPPQMSLAPDLASLFASSDVVSLHLAYCAQTRHIIDAGLLEAMRPGSLLVNTARAEIVDAGALHHCLVEGPLAHAAIDTFAPEPPLPDDPLLGLDNVTLTAHAAWKTPDASRQLLSRGLTELWRPL